MKPVLFALLPFLAAFPGAFAFEDEPVVATSCELYLAPAELLLFLHSSGQK